MDINEILKRVDHTLLSVNATENEIKAVCDDAVKFGCASVCIAPSYVEFAARYVNKKIPVCTVIGFPNGYQTAKTKVFETQNAIQNGADEIDMVINIGFFKDKKYEQVLDEIKSVKEACSNRILKVITETCLLSREEKIKICEIVSSSGADFIKTSTGFSSGGATKEDIEIFAKHKSESLKIKAAGGISTLKDAEKFILLGADRLGTSRIVKIIKGQDGNGGY